MRGIVERAGLLLALAVLLPLSVSAQDVEPVPSDEPTWLLLERGRAAFDARELGTALRLFREVRERNGSLPEVDIEIGRVFEAEGELSLALAQYERAYERRTLLTVPDDAIDLLYRMAHIRRQREEYLQYEQLLQTVVEQTAPDYYQPPAEIEDSLYRIVTTEGLDKLLELYRLPDHGAQRAHFLLAEVLLYEGRRAIEAARSATFSVIMTLTEIVSFARYIDPEYEFTTVEDLLETTHRFERVRQYRSDTALFEQLYVLGHALYTAQRFGTAEEIRSLLVRVDPGGRAGIRAARGYPPLE